MTAARPYLTLAEAGALMGIKGTPKNVAKKARRVIEAKERRIRKPILLRCGGQGKGVRYMVSEWMLKKRMPEAFSRRDELLLRFKEEIEKLKEHMAEQASLIEHLGQKVAILHKTVDKWRNYAISAESGVAESRRESSESTAF